VLGAHAQLWCHAITLMGEIVLEGISRIKGRCSAIGRNAITADVQASSGVKLPCDTTQSCRCKAWFQSTNNTEDQAKPCFQTFNILCGVPSDMHGCPYALVGCKDFPGEPED
jgi:hypothetical protein